MNRSLRVLITDRAWPDCSIERQILGSAGAEILEAPAADEATLVELAHDVDAIGTCWAKVTDRVIEASPRCRVIARFGIGLDNIDIQAATRRAIPVTNVPNYCVSEVSDHALAMILACGRNIAFFHARTKAGEYRLAAAPPMRRLSDTTLGIIGFGHIGRALFAKARGLGFKLLVHTRSGDDHGTGCRMVALETLLDESDFVSLHLPSTDATRHLISARQFEHMKRSAFLINTSRGALIDQKALEVAILSGRIAGAALDVFDPEPPNLAEPLFRDERLIVTPHAAFSSEQSLRELRTRASHQIAQVLQGIRPEYVVNPEVYERS